MEQMVDEMCGRSVDNFALEQVIGVGRTSTCYLARHKILGRKVCLKLLRDGSTDLACARFSYEARVSCMVSGADVRGIARALDFGISQDGRLYLVQDVAPGVTLAKLSCEVLPVTVAISIFLSVCDALAHMHSYGVIHSRLTPTDIIVDRTLLEQQKGVTVIDFGDALMVGDSNQYSEPANHKYASPEQMKGKYDHRADIYAAGLIMRDGLSGDSLHSDLPSGLEEVLSKCSAAEPKDRYGSAADLAKQLREIQKSLN